LSETMVIVAGI